jgi:hypothetical protein
MLVLTAKEAQPWFPGNATWFARLSPKLDSC